MREDWIRRAKEQGDADAAAQLRVDGRPLADLELAALRVMLARLSWASLHWGTERVDPDAWLHLAVAFIRAGWRPPAPARVIPSRASDPETSHKAEPPPVRAGTQRARLLAAFGLPAAADGLTDEEAADLADGVPYRSEFAKRCSELRAAGHLEVVDGVTRAGIAGHQRIVSRITDAGRATLAGLPKPDESA